VKPAIDASANVCATTEGTCYFRQLGRLSLGRYWRRGVVRRWIAITASAVACVIATSTATTTAAVTTPSLWAVSVVLAVCLGIALVCGLSLPVGSECGSLNWIVASSFVVELMNNSVQRSALVRTEVTAYCTRIVGI
jgi:hypothetical protein